MSRIYRVMRKAYARMPFDGEGAYRYGGRWSSPGTRLSYTSEYQSLAMLELFVHLDEDDSPVDLVLATAELPAAVARERIDLHRLPRNWREPAAPPELAQLGDEFVRMGKSCVLIVPSVLAPEEANYLINPLHTDFRKIEILGIEPLRYDARLFRKERESRRR